MNCSRRRFKSRNPEGFRSDSIPGLEHPPETIWYLKCTNRLRGWFESSYWEHRIFSHMRSCQCKNYIFWTTGTQVMIFYLEFIEDSSWEILHLSNHTSLGLKIFYIWKGHKRSIFHHKIGLLNTIRNFDLQKKVCYRWRFIHTMFLLWHKYLWQVFVAPTFFFFVFFFICFCDIFFFCVWGLFFDHPFGFFQTLAMVGRALGAVSKQKWWIRPYQP